MIKIGYNMHGKVVPCVGLVELSQISSNELLNRLRLELVECIPNSEWLNVFGSAASPISISSTSFRTIPAYFYLKHEDIELEDCEEVNILSSILVFALLLIITHVIINMAISKVFPVTA
ncbi:MAG: hypothetical protein IPJ86_06270 [Bacteroidetes bacterium]|nr:hypothetical protein [Bacteroidota bacterium]